MFSIFQAYFVFLIQGHTVDFPPSKLKQGWGEHCIYILDRLADEALKSTNFVWKRWAGWLLHNADTKYLYFNWNLQDIKDYIKNIFHRPTYPEEETEEENIVEDDSELNLNEIEKSMVLGVSLTIFNFAVVFINIV